MNKKILLVSIFLLAGLVLAGCTHQAEKEESNPDYSSSPEQEQEQLNGEDSNSEDGSQTSISSILERAENIDSIKYDLVTTLSDGEEQEMSIWWKGDKIRAETSMETSGQEVESVYFLHREEEMSYIYIPVQNRAMSMDYSNVKDEVGDTPKSQSLEIQAKDFEVLGEETWDGKDTVIIEYSLEGGNNVKTWVWKEYGLPVRIVSSTTEGEVVTELRNIEFTDISDDKLELPEGVQVMDMPTGLGY